MQRKNCNLFFKILFYFFGSPQELPTATSSIAKALAAPLNSWKCTLCLLLNASLPQFEFNPATSVLSIQ